MSAPHNDEDNPSLNNLIDKSEFSLSYVTMDDAIQLFYVVSKRSQNNVIKKRLSITADILKQLWKVLDNGVFSSFVDLMLKCMFSCAYLWFS